MDLSLLLAQGLDAELEFFEGQLEVRQGLQELVDFLLRLGVLELLADAVFCEGVEQDVGDLVDGALLFAAPASSLSWISCISLIYGISFSHNRDEFS